MRCPQPIYAYNIGQANLFWSSYQYIYWLLWYSSIYKRENKIVYLFLFFYFISTFYFCTDLHLNVIWCCNECCRRRTQFSEYHSVIHYDRFSLIRFSIIIFVTQLVRFQFVGSHFFLCCHFFVNFGEKLQWTRKNHKRIYSPAKNYVL